DLQRVTLDCVFPSLCSQGLELVCLLLSFKPNKANVKWLVNGKESSPPTPAFSSRYFIYSKLNVLVSEWEWGDTYACMVGHEGLPMTFIHWSMDKASGKPTAINVSVILSGVRSVAVCGICPNKMHQCVFWLRLSVRLIYRHMLPPTKPRCIHPPFLSL
uniref:Ig-like domain-containing protein n=1 Tax=Gopherus evgoodei TaxID=1825980 RepID=A0A8C5F2R1_9SAUR